MLWCQSAQNIGLSKRKLKSVLKCTVWSQYMAAPDRRTDRQTDRRTNERHRNSATFILRTHRAL